MGNENYDVKSHLVQGEMKLEMNPHLMKAAGVQMPFRTADAHSSTYLLIGSSQVDDAE